MKKRKFSQESVDQIDFSVIETDSFISTWFLNYCVLVSESENFIIRTIRSPMKKIDDETLLENLKTCIFQETQHALSHKYLNERYFKHNPSIQYVNKLANFINFKLLEKIFPEDIRLSVASAIEQLNAEISYYGLENIDQITKEENFKQLLYWHFVEEIEHRDYVFDLMKERNVSNKNVHFGAQLTLFSFCFWISFGALVISLTKKPSLVFEIKDLFAANSPILRMQKSIRKYLNTDYHPSDEQIPTDFYKYQNLVTSLE